MQSSGCGQYTIEIEQDGVESVTAYLVPHGIPKLQSMSSYPAG
jgi:hypothetical protein